MPTQPDFDLQAAHKYFAPTCFNQAWDWIDKPQRTPEEEQQMILLSMASLWHWTQREDCTNQNLSIGYWQASRVHALAGRVDEARRYGQLGLQVSHAEPPFYLGYAYEALARAEMRAGDQEKMREYLAEAGRLAAAVADPEERKMLEADLKTIG